jgi:hypothetical protein
VQNLQVYKINTKVENYSIKSPLSANTYSLNSGCIRVVKELVRKVEKKIIKMRGRDYAILSE